MKRHLKPLTAALCFFGLITLPAFAESQADYDAQIRKNAFEIHQLKKEINHLKAQVVPKHKHHSYVQTKHVNLKKPFDETAGDAGYEPFDPDVPGEAFVSTGPYVGVQVEYSGSNLIINSPSVNTDVQLLGIRKTIHQRLAKMGALSKEDTSHSHLLFSGVIEGQASYFNNAARSDTSDIDVSNVSIDALLLGPTNWTLGYIDLTYDGANPAINFHRTANSRVFVNKAFVTLGDLEVLPWYATFGQYYVPFGNYSSALVSDPLAKILTRTKARAVTLGFQQQDKNAFYAAAYVFRGDTHASSTTHINNGGFNGGYKFNQGIFKGVVSGGIIANMADSVGMQVANNFSLQEHIAHRVPAYNVRAMVNIGTHLDFIGEFVGATKRFNPNDMAFNGHGAKPWALDTQAAYSFMIFENKPSALVFGYSTSRDALTIGIPKHRYSVVFNTSLLRHTLQALEFRRDRLYSGSNVGTKANGVVVNGRGGFDNVVTAQFDYYF